MKFFSFSPSLLKYIPPYPPPHLVYRKMYSSRLPWSNQVFLQSLRPAPFIALLQPTMPLSPSSLVPLSYFLALAQHEECSAFPPLKTKHTYTHRHAHTHTHKCSLKKFPPGFPLPVLLSLSSSSHLQTNESLVILSLINISALLDVTVSSFLEGSPF